MAATQSHQHIQVIVRGTLQPRTLGLTSLQRSTREALRLGAGTVVMSGHQGELWHAGIAAKWYATDAVARRHQASRAWVVVDHDGTMVDSVTYPARGTQGVVRKTWAWAAGGSDDAGESVRGLRGACAVADAPRDAWDDGITQGLARAHAALQQAQHRSDTRAVQATLAAGALLGSGAGMSLVRASRLHDTPIFQAFLRAIEDDALNCVRAYNQATMVDPGAGVRALAVSASRVELPLWIIGASGVRRSATVRVGERVQLRDGESLAPKALLLTALLRLAACDLFLHGLGGEQYDRVTATWLEAWRAGWTPAMMQQHAALAALTLAPTLVVSATMRVALTGVEVPDVAALDRLIWTGHHSGHTPGLLGDAAGQARKDELVYTIAAARAAGEDPRPHYRALHALLEEVRTHRAESLAARVQEAKRAAMRRSEAALVVDRTWPVCFHSPQRLADLRDGVEQDLASAGRGVR